jgi:hypothetical protein
MYKSLFSLIIIFFSSTILAQTKKKFVVNPGEKLVDVIPFTEIYKYPEFKIAKVMLRDGTATQAKLNYNCVFGEMQFIDPKGDTLSIADEKNIKWIAVEKDTFYFDEGWLELIANNNTLKIALNKMIEMANREKIGAMDVPGFGAIETYNKSTMSQHMRDLVAKERLTFTQHITYYLGDRFNDFSTSNKKNLLKIYGLKQEKVEKYLHDNKIHFENGEDLKRLCVELKDF